MKSVGIVTERGLILQPHEASTIFIPEETIDGICQVLVNGRDIEDGYAPIEVIASVIEEHLHDKGPWQLVGPTDEDNWLTMPIEPDGDGEGFQPIYECCGLAPTGLEIALAHLTMFGGSRDSIVITKG